MIWTEVEGTQLLAGGSPRGAPSFLLQSGLELRREGTP